MCVLKIFHTCFFKFLLAEEKKIVFNFCSAGHALCYPVTFIRVAAVDHGVEIVLPVLLGFSLIAVRYLSKPGQDLAGFFYPGIGHGPGNHGIGTESCLLMTQRGPESPYDASFLQVTDPLQEFFFGYAYLLCHNGKWLRVKGKVSLNKAYYLFVNTIYHAQLTPGSGINPIFILDGLVKSPSIQHSGRVIILSTESLRGNIGSQLCCQAGCLSLIHVQGKTKIHCQRW
jgi:hypothetical protein